ncbi:MAG: ATP-binding protein [Betaproteobacteria bacterium]|nr:ATP-binding protein [Betaproteobacteria bacterium]
MKVGLYVAAALAVVMLIFIALVVDHQRKQLLEQAASHVNQLSDVISKSTRFAMLHNQPTYVDLIIHDVVNKERIDRVRIFNKDGRIIHSTYPPELGVIVDRKAEACFHCHQSEKPLERIPQNKRSRVFDSLDGRHLLANMEVIRNEPSCYEAACHQHTKAQSVLGVLDVVYSLEDMDRTLRNDAITLGVFSLGFVIFAALSVSFLVHRLVHLPLRDLETGAGRLAAGNLDHTIPVRSADELGRLATSFNSMTTALRNSQLENDTWARTLEQKVETRTRELRAAEAEAARGEKLASVGLLAAGIAHELNNPLTGVLTFSHLLRKKMPDGSPDAEDMDLVIQETKRCAAIIRRLLDFAREKKPEKKFSDLNQIIEETERIIERPAHLRDIEIRKELDPDLPPVWVDADQIKQVVMNILVNAQQAIDRKGTITVRTRIAPEPKRADPLAEPVGMVEISVADTGCGIPKKDLQRIFDPFFTSKAVGKGTGLGLSVSHGIVRAHGGAIEVDSAVGEGTTFRIYLPLEPDTNTADAPGNERPA